MQCRDPVCREYAHRGAWLSLRQQCPEFVGRPAAHHYHPAGYDYHAPLSRVIPPLLHTADQADLATSTSLTLCADHRFCCRADTYCFYDARGQPSCWAGTAYTFSYYYLWSHRWYRTATSFQLAATSVVTITVPTATEPPAATESTVRAPVETGAAGLAGLAGSVEMVTAGSVAAVKTVTATVTVTPSTSAAGRGRGRVAVLVLAVLAACLVGICGMAVHPYVVTAYAG